MNSSIRKIIALALVLILTLSCSVFISPSTALASTSISRISGSDRFATAAEIAGAGFDSADTVVLASGRSYPDALAGVPLAYALNAPIMLVDTNSIPSSTMDQIRSLGASNVYILGGNAAVSSSVERQLINSGLSVTRLSGKNRYETAAAVGLRLCTINGTPDTVYIVGAENYPDALSASPIAALNGAPVIYSNSRAAIDGKSADLIRDIDPDRVYVIGGNAAVGSQINSSLRNCGVSSCERIYGKSRYETSLKVNQRFSSLFSGDGAILVTGENYPDALVGGVYAAVNRIPLLLTSSKQISTSGLSTATPSNGYDSTLSFAENLVRYLASRNPSTLTVLGGTKALSDEAVRSYINGSAPSAPGSSDAKPFDPSELGSYAKNFKWSLSGGTLTLSGTGRMPDWDHEKSKFAPWYNSKDKITKVVIKSGLTSIGDYAFMDCVNLNNVSIPTSVKSVGVHAFTYCTALKNLKLPSGVRNIGEWAFAYCTYLTGFELPASLVKLDNFAFCECRNITEIVIPNGVPSISHQAFYYCMKLRKVVLGSGVRDIQAWAFAYCVALDDIIIPEGVTTIKDRAFYKCESLKQIVLPDSVTELVERVFIESGIEKAVIGDGIKELGSAFSHCEKLKSVVIGDNVRETDHSFYDCCNLTHITWGRGLKTIGSSTFSGCERLTSVDIPEGVTTIEHYAFGDCHNLTSVTIPDSVTSISHSAFSYCYNLTVYAPHDQAYYCENGIRDIDTWYNTTTGTVDPGYDPEDPPEDDPEMPPEDDPEYPPEDDPGYPPDDDPQIPPEDDPEYPPEDNSGLCELLIELTYNEEPLAGHLVELYDYYTDEYIDYDITDDGGWCVIMVPEGTYQITIWEPDYYEDAWVHLNDLKFYLPDYDSAYLRIDLANYE